MSDDWRTDRIGSAHRGENPTVLRRLDAGFAVIGDTQFLPGYCVLLVDEVGVERLSDLPRGKRMAFLSDMDRLGEAVERACRQSDAAFRRVNLEILGNTDTFLHVHVWPRFEWEPEELVAGPVWLYPEERWTSEEFALGARHDQLREAIGVELDQLPGIGSLNSLVSRRTRAHRMLPGPSLEYPASGRRACASRCRGTTGRPRRRGRRWC